MFKGLKSGLTAAGAAVIVAGQAAMVTGHSFPGALVTALGFALLAAGLGFADAWLPQGVALARRPALAAAPAARGKSRGAGAPKARARLRPALALPAFKPWNPFKTDFIDLPAWSVLVPAALLLVVMQSLLLQGKVPLAIVALLAGLMFLTVYFQRGGRLLRIPHLNHNTRLVAWLGVSAVPQVMGAAMLWEYRYVVAGYLLVLLGASLSLWALGTRGLRLEEDGAASGSALHWRPSSSTERQGALTWKAGLVGGALLSWYLASGVFAGTQPGLSVSFGFLAILLLLASFPWFPRSLSTWPGWSLRRRAVSGLAGSLAGLALGWAGQALLDQGRLEAGLNCLLAGGILLVLSLPLPWDRDHETSQSAGQKPRQWSRWIEPAAVIVLGLAAFAFRAWHISILPFGAEGDEAGGGIWAMDATHGNVENPLVSANVPLPMIQLWGICFRVFGVNLLGLRAISVFFGVLSVFSLYFFARQAWGRWAAFLSALLMSFSFWHLHYSRFGHTLIQQVFLEMAAFYFIWKAIKSGKFWQFAVGGFAFGLAMLPHIASRLLPFEAMLLLAYFLLDRREILRRHLGGLLVFVIAAWMASAPAVVYWVHVLPGSMNRTKNVSIFDKTNTNAPADVLAGFVANCKVSTLMFNVAGDMRLRDNPVAPSKILESVTAMLFALGFLWALYHWRDPLHLFALICMFVNLCASIFSVEAPQTLRTAGNIPIVFLFIAALVHAMRRLAASADKRWGTAVFVALSLPFFAVASYRSGARYFEEHGLAFDVIPTLVGQSAGAKEGKHYQAIFAATGFAAGHPPVQLFRQHVPVGNYFNVSEFLPLAGSADTGCMVELADDYRGFAPWLSSLYPDAKQEEIKDVRNQQPLITTFDITPEIRRKAQGLEARLTGAHQPDLDGGQPLAWPLPGAGPGATGAEWQGSFFAQHYATYRFDATAHGRFSLDIDGRPVAPSINGKGGKETALAMGLHSIRARYQAAGPGDRLDLRVDSKPVSPGKIFALDNALNRPLDRSDFFHIQPCGYKGAYYAGGNWEGTPVAETVEPALMADWLDSPILGGWSARWKARLKVDKAGKYSFNAITGAFAEIRVDGQLVARTGAPVVPVLKPAAVHPGPMLQAGWHQIEVSFATGGYPWLQVQWAGPGIPQQLLIGPALSPLGGPAQAGGAL